MQIIELKFPLDKVEDLFPCPDPDGHNVQVSNEAKELAATSLKCKAEELLWHTPDVFSVRYGSSYVATAHHNGNRVRFHSDEGDFKEGDDHGWF